ncbi:GTP pyrophosphokinase [Corynebacterium sp. 335C]
MIKELRARYDAWVAAHPEAAREFSAAVRELLYDAGLAFDNVTARVKQWRSLRAKAVSRNPDGSFAYPDPWEDLHDLVGVRVTTYHSTEIPGILSVLGDAFEVLREIDKGLENRVAGRLGYGSHHLILRVPEDPAAEVPPGLEAYRGLMFEVQVRTVLQHAWAEFEHDVRYKSNDVDPRVNRAFALAAGLIELADQQFDQIAAILDEGESADAAQAAAGAAGPVGAAGPAGAPGGAAAAAADPGSAAAGEPSSRNHNAAGGAADQSRDDASRPGSGSPGDAVPARGRDDAPGTADIVQRPVERADDVELTAGTLPGLLTLLLPGLPPSKSEHYPWLEELLRHNGVRTVGELKELIEPALVRRVGEALRYRFTPGHVRIVDDLLLARHGEAHAEKTGRTGAHPKIRPQRLSSRLAQLREAGIVADGAEDPGAGGDAEPAQED